MPVSSEASRALLADLTRVLDERPRADAVSRAIYATDASIYEVTPLAVCYPRDGDELAAISAVAARHGAPLLARGAGTSLAGQSVNAAVVIDFSRHMQRVVSIDPQARRARVQPGLVLERLNRAAAKHGLRFGPDVAPANRATIGGMIGNNSCGAHSPRWGKTREHVLALSCRAADGARFRFEPTPGGLAAAALGPGRSAELARALEPLLARHVQAIASRYPQIPRRVSGYNLDGLLEADPVNLSELLVGSEGTLALVEEAELRLVESPRHSVLGICGYPALDSALEQLDAILELGPAAVELVDALIVERAREHPEYRRQAELFETKLRAFLLVEFMGEEPGELAAALERLERLGAASFQRLDTAAAQQQAWSIRKAGLGLAMGMRGDPKPVAFVEDTAVAPERLPAYTREFQRLMAEEQLPVVYYGHASAGCLHIRPVVDLKRPEGVAQLERISRAVAGLVERHGGVMSGEHGDGRARSRYLGQLFGGELLEAFRAVKTIFDPEGRLNPGNLVAPLDPTQALRYGDGYLRRDAEPSLLDWSGEGGFQRAVELCNGNAACRKLDTGTMCPSYMVTGDEEHSTRGRANALRAWLGGRLPEGQPSEARLRQTLDLCLSCKGCRRECPSEVDMSRMKLEFMGRLRARGEASLRDRLLARLPWLLERAGRAGWLLAPLARSLPARLLLEPTLGLDFRRRLPRPARQSFKRWFDTHTPAPSEAPEVLLLADTWTNHFEPRLGQAALRVLEAAGFRVSLAPIECCGRTLLSKGFVDEARALTRRNLDALEPRLRGDVVLVGLEPSCLLGFRDEALALCPGPEARRVAGHSLLFEELLASHPMAREWLASLRLERRVVLHPHCHHKALPGPVPPGAALRQVAGLELETLDAGCCGMAGAFGYEREHYQLSQAVGERVLLPEVRRAHDVGHLVVADGYSCRSQISDATGHRALHTAEVLARALESRL